MADAADDPVLDQLCAIIRNELRGRDVDIVPETPLTELGLDSLDIISLTDVVENHFDVRFDDADFTQVSTVAELEALTISHIDKKTCAGS